MRLRAKGSRNYHFQLEIVNEILNFMFEQFRKFLTRKSFMLSWVQLYKRFVLEFSEVLTWFPTVDKCLRNVDQ